MASIRQLKSGKWNVQIRRAGSKPKSKTFATEAEAVGWVAAQENRSKRKDVEKPTWTEMAYRYCDTVLEGKPSRHSSRALAERLGRDAKINKPYDRITVVDLNTFKEKRLREVSKTTVHWELVFIRRVFRWLDKEARSQGKNPVSNPAEFLSIPKPKGSRSRVVTEAELQLLLGALSPAMSQVVELAYETAMRRSEIIKLRIKDIHLSERILSVVEGKEGDRSVPLSKRAVELLSEAARAIENPNKRLFPFSKNSITQAVRRARQKVGLDSDVRLHQLRHTRCTIVARKGFNQAQIMAVTGHKDVRSVQRYTHLNAKDVVDLL